MSHFTNPLDNIHIAAPCPANWEEMSGDDRKRYCSQCQLNVYNLSSMTRKEAERLLIESEGRLCVRFYRRADGTIITQNCPKGLAAIKRRISLLTTAALSTVLTFLSGVGISTAFSPKQNEFLGETVVPIKTIKPLNNDSSPKQFESTMGSPLPLPIQGKVAVINKYQKRIY